MSNTIILKAKGVRSITRNEMLSIDLPKATDRYTPISNKQIIMSALEEIDKQGLVVRNEFYKTDSSSSKFVGGFTVSSQGNSEMDMFFGIKNSYDKSMSAAYATGAQVLICSNSCVSGEHSLIRKHTGNADRMLEQSIRDGVSRIGDYFRKMELDLDFMKNVEIDKLLCAELAGRLFIEEDIINTQQMSILKKEIKIESYNYGIENSLFNLYQGVTHSLKSTHPSLWMKNHMSAHAFFMGYYNELQSAPATTIDVPVDLFVNESNDEYVEKYGIDTERQLGLFENVEG